MTPMGFRKLLGWGAAVALMAGGLTFVGSSPAIAAPACTPTMNFVVGGTGDPDGVWVPLVPPGPRTNIQYPASISPVAGAYTGNHSIEVGTDKLSRAVNDYRAQCPNSHINVVGHSLGAVVVTDVCDTLTGPRARGVTCYTSGNPKHPGTGIMGNLPTVIPGLDMPGNRVPNAGGPVHHEYCNVRDIYCNSGNPLQDPGHFVDAAVGTFLQGQHGYPVNPVAPVIPSTPVPVPMPNPHGLEVVNELLVPDAPPVFSPYVATPVKDFLPPVVARFVPEVVGGFVPPPLPVLPVLPRIPGL